MQTSNLKNINFLSKDQFEALTEEQAGELYAVDASAYLSALSNQAGNAGKFLTTNGTETSWATVQGGGGGAGGLPSGGTAGQILTKTDDGSEWADAAPAAIIREW